MGLNCGRAAKIYGGLWQRSEALHSMPAKKPKRRADSREPGMPETGGRSAPSARETRRAAAEGSRAAARVRLRGEPGVVAYRAVNVDLAAGARRHPGTACPRVRADFQFACGNPVLICPSRVAVCHPRRSWRERTERGCRREPNTRDTRARPPMRSRSIQLAKRVGLPSGGQDYTRRHLFVTAWRARLGPWHATWLCRRAARRK
jgi:hypothetical protein